MKIGNPKRLARLVFAGFAIAFVTTWCILERRRAAEPPKTILQATVMMRLVRHDAAGLVFRQAIVRDSARARAILSAVGADALPSSACLDDYTGTDADLVLVGSDAYARKTVHLYRLYDGERDASPAEAVLSSARGCARGPIVDPPALRASLVDAGL